ncbi:MAG: hypothetical protein LBV33_07905 [Lachnospiraceae bacterium]|nr:hypothetical protein [Lachnospiraceae bacterium]
MFEAFGRRYTSFRPETAFASDSMLDQLEARGYLTPGQVLNGKWATGEGGGSKLLRRLGG